MAMTPRQSSTIRAPAVAMTAIRASSFPCGWNGCGSATRPSGKAATAGRFNDRPERYRGRFFLSWEDVNAHRTPRMEPEEKAARDVEGSSFEAGVSFNGAA